MLLLLACAGGPAEDSGVTGPVYDPNPPDEIGGDRPAAVVLPTDYAVDREWPLVVLLHGYGANAALQDVIFGLGLRVDELGFILVMPEGTVDESGAQFWNATDECCDFYGTGVDDVAYLSGLIDEARTRYPVSTVSLVGHSNGGYMSYRMACDTPERLDRIAVLAGATYADEADCVGTKPVSVLHAHGTLDESVAYESGGGHAGALESVERWATKAGCSGTQDLGTRDYVEGLEGEETTATEWTGCSDGVDIQLWTIAGGDHILIDNNTSFKDDLATWAVAPE